MLRLEAVVLRIELLCFAANSFYCLRLPIYPMLEGGDPNSMLGKKVLWVVAASQQTLFIVSGSQPIQC